MPASASSRADASPMPVPAPVIQTILPSSVRMDLAPSLTDTDDPHAELRPMSPSADPPSAGLRARTARFQDWWGALPPNARGSVWLLLRSLTFSVLATAIKLLVKALPVVEIMFFRPMFVLFL